MTIQGNPPTSGASASALRDAQGAVDQNRPVGTSSPAQLAPHEVTLHATALLRDAPKAVNQTSRELALGNGLIVRVPVTNDAVVIRPQDGEPFSGLSIALDARGQVAYTIDMDPVAPDAPQLLAQWGPVLASAAAACRAAHHGHRNPVAGKLSQTLHALNKFITRRTKEIDSIGARRPGDEEVTGARNDPPRAEASGTTSADTAATSTTPVPGEDAVMGFALGDGVTATKYQRVADASLDIVRKRMGLGLSAKLTSEHILTASHDGSGYSVHFPAGRQWTEVYTDAASDESIIRLNNERIHASDPRADGTFQIMQMVVKHFGPK